jgi:hypothetical protein
LLFADPGQFQKILVITSEFHLPRTEAAFDWIYSLEPRARDYQLSYEESPNTGLPDQTLHARISREENSLKTLNKLKEKLKTLTDFQDWFYTEHGAYAVQSCPEELADDVLDSY